MRTAQWVRLLVLAFAFMSVAGVMAVLACGPSAPAAPAGGAGNVSDSVSVPTEVPFMLPQSGDGGNGEPTAEPTAEPTETRYVPPTADWSLCRDEYSWPYLLRDGSYDEPVLLGTRCPPDGHPAVASELRNYYNAAMQEIEALEAKGETGEFPELRISVRASTAGAVDAVLELLEANGARLVAASRKPDGGVTATVSIRVVPQLAEIDGVSSVGLPAEELGPRLVVEERMRVEYGLQEKYRASLIRNRDRTARGETGGFPLIRVSIIPWGEDDADPIVEFLSANGGKNVTWTKDEDDPVVPGVIEADVSLGLIGDLDQFDGVQRIEEIKSTSKAKPGGSGGSGVRVVPTSMPVPARISVAMQADQWHRAGYTGAGVEVAVIDGDFRNFGTRIIPLLSQPVEFLCYGADGPVEGTLSSSSLAASGDPAGSFSACERTSTPGGDPHGTAVVEALLDIAPDVKLYIANPDSPSRRVEVLRWLTAREGDNEPEFAEFADYKVNGNDDFKVKVIIHPGGSEWDGPGDGTSTFDDYENRSYLNLVEDAVQKGVLWVNAAGNEARVTWFKRVSASDFISGSVRVLKFHAAANCNEVGIVDDEPYFFPCGGVVLGQGLRRT